MPITLKSALSETLRDWKSDLDPAWREALRDVEPDFDAVDEGLSHEPWEPIFPSRKGDFIPGAPDGAHIFRALDGLPPERVRAVIIGQDPYPNVSWATGRAFEQGALDSWPEDAGMVSGSLRNIALALAAFRSGGDEYTRPAGGWQALTRDLKSGRLELHPPRRLFDHWQRQGVLCLNAGLTLSRYVRGGAPHQLNGHIPLWRPVVLAVLQAVAARDAGRVVFMLWGRVARDFFTNGGVESAAREAGTWGERVGMARHSHPTALSDGRPAFFNDPNPFADANRVLVQDLGADPVRW